MTCLRMKGRVWKYGDRIPNDGGLLSRKYEKLQIYDPRELAKWCLEDIDPRFANEVEPGDIVVAGKRFGEGNHHIQGFLALKGAGVGVVVESIPRGALRSCIHAGVPILPSCPGVTATIDGGSEIEVDFETGEVIDRSAGRSFRFEPLPADLLRIIKAGGAPAYIRDTMLAKTSPS
ncbi:MAG: 3-isopropylmalate dehydratase [Ignavibacteriales bacterium]